MESEFFGTERISRILMRLAPPVMLAQLIQALYNIVDSFFVGRFSDTGLTALSIVYPLQLLMIALAVGTGVGINTAMAYFLGTRDRKRSDEAAGISTALSLVMWAVFALLAAVLMPAYARMSTESEAVIADVIVYGRIVCVCSIGLFLESGWTKVLQAEGNMNRPMAAQILGAVTNIVLDPLLILDCSVFRRWELRCGRCYRGGANRGGGHRVERRLSPFPGMGAVSGAGAAGLPAGNPQYFDAVRYTFYILGLNLILSTFSDQAVTALGLYYKWQTFFFIPLGAMQTWHRCRSSAITMPREVWTAAAKHCGSPYWRGMALMLIGTLCFELIPGPMLRFFSRDAEVIAIGTYGFRWIGPSFLPMVTSLIFPVFFQAVGSAGKSSLLTILRTVVLFVPLGWLFAHWGLHAFWLTYPVTELITTAVGFLFYRQFLRAEAADGAAAPQTAE